MFNPKTNYAKIAYDAILFFVSTGKVKEIDQSKISQDLKLNRASIVSVLDSDDNLISNFGGIEPKKSNLYEEIIENSIGAAENKESRSISSDDLSKIKVYVDVLSVPHIVEDFSELKPHKHGLFIKDSKGNAGYIMPNLKGVKTHEKQIDIIREKYGIKDKLDVLEIRYFKVTRYD